MFTEVVVPWSWVPQIEGGGMERGPSAGCRGRERSQGAGLDTARHRAVGCTLYFNVFPARMLSLVINSILCLFVHGF